jgi:putative protease
MLELLAPAGNAERLSTALYFGADAVYLAYKDFGLRAFADNFDLIGLKAAVEKCHELNKKVYITLNVFARNEDFAAMTEFVRNLSLIRPDGVLVSDLGVLALVKKNAPDVDIHLSTQANLTNVYAAKEYIKMGVKRLVMARELSLDEIRGIKDGIGDGAQIEAFVHGAMCMSYSGRCLLSNYLTGRRSNHGECAQSCRWEYAICEKTREGEYMPIEEDARGSYILNSKDMNMIKYIDLLAKAGVDSLKIEGRMKTAYYVASVVGAYRRAIDLYLKSPDSYSLPKEIEDELDKAGHREYCTGFYFPDKTDNESYSTSKPVQKYDFIASVLSSFDGGAIVEMRNRFKVGDELEVLSPNPYHNSIITVAKMEDESGAEIDDALKVQQKVKLYTSVPLQAGDFLRKKSDKAQ